ncbi:MAG TPA: ATP-binding protein [Anaerolineae bacterium]|nr:ATP-binding protein [Anaerolineae bacterium]
MLRFIDRQQDLRDLDALKQTLLRRKTAQFAAVYGRRRVGKTTLLLHWVQQSDLPYLYWLAKEESPDAVRQGCARALWRWKYPDQADAPRFETWESLFEQMAALIDQPLVMLFDEFPYAVASDRSLPSHLQAAWDHLFKDKPVILILAGSHIGMMADLLDYNAPLYGRMTAQLAIDPLPFAALSEFFPRWPTAEQVAAYAVLGGIPAYLERFDPDRSLTVNIKEHLFSRTGMFRSEPTVLISDLARKTRKYEAVVRAIGGGQHTPSDIGKTLGVPSPNVMPYLRRLVKMGLVERRVPVTLPPDQRQTTTRSRYHLRDSYLRFYFRFIDPNIDMVEQGLKDALWDIIAEQFRSFIGTTAFEEICREWTLVQARARRLPFIPETVGSHWASDAQVDVVAISWRRRSILLGECKWTVGRVDRGIVRELVDKTPLVRRALAEAEKTPGKDWTVHYALFSRAGFTDAARAEAKTVGAQLVALAELDADLQRALVSADTR